MTFSRPSSQRAFSINSLVLSFYLMLEIIHAGRTTVKRNLPALIVSPGFTNAPRSFWSLLLVIFLALF
jgi:hypothetical protein